MIGDYVRSLEGIGTLGILGLLASMAFFVGIVVRVCRTPARHAEAMARLPLEDDSSGSSHHNEVAP